VDIPGSNSIPIFALVRFWGDKKGVSQYLILAQSSFFFGTNEGKLHCKDSDHARPHILAQSKTQNKSLFSKWKSTDLERKSKNF
jgi:hypothetical protein